LVSTFLDPRFKDTFADEFSAVKIKSWLTREIERNCDPLFVETGEESHESTPEHLNVHDVVAMATRKRKGLFFN
jgi:hypothetical protein